jgi:hypothetical protein
MNRDAGIGAIFELQEKGSIKVSTKAVSIFPVGKIDTHESES